MTEAGQSPEDLESEVEATRERLAQNIDTLLYRASPKTVAKREVHALKATFVDDDGNVRVDNVVKAVGAVAGFVAVVVVLRRVTR
ncbi:DUF3618 domain-containing protein [Nocardioidaceae bacterium]|nr:DUF3618 domain-containing protein [Nocardioidaceae bacterium]